MFSSRGVSMALFSHLSRRSALSRDWANQLIAIVFAVSFFIWVPPASSRRNEPAVREMNSHATASFDHSEFDLDEAGEFRTELGRLTGVVSIPIDRELAARVFVSPFYQGVEGRSTTEFDQGGIAAGGDLFLRYPALFEISIGPRYEWAELDDDSLHSLGAEGVGKLFLNLREDMPYDLGLVGRVRDTELGRGRQTGGRAFGAEGYARLYLGDRFSFEANGFWDRVNQSGGRHVIRSGGGAEVQALIPAQRPITLSLGASGGVSETDDGLEVNDAPFYSVGVGITVSFPGAASLVELERNYY